MTGLQRDANRDFTPAIINLMRDVYERCTDERGPGCYMRMKDLMGDHVGRARHVMFGAATQTVTGHLNQMCKALEEKMLEKVDEIFLGMKRDYMQVLGGITTDQTETLPKDERTLRAEIRYILLTVDGQFESIASGEIEDIEVGESKTDDEEEEPLEGTALVFDSAPQEEGEPVKYDQPPARKTPTRPVPRLNIPLAKYNPTSGETSPTKTSGSDEMRYPADLEITASSYEDNEEGAFEETEEGEGRIEQKLGNEVDDEDDEMGEEL